MTRLGAWQPVLSGSGADLDGLLVVQNSRGVAALAGGLLRWSYVAPLNAAQYTQSAPGYGGLCRPARAAGIVAARLETRGARFELIGFDARSGVIRWRWHGSTGVEEPVGSPAVWRGSSFLVPLLRTGTDGCELFLAVIDATTGRESFRISLSTTGQAAMNSPACGNASLAHYRNLAAPAGVGDRVYVDTGRGMVCALDLQDESVRWARIYQRKFNDAGGGMRVPISPVVGSRNVFFAPVDSRWVLLVDRASGALVQRRTDLSWTSIGRCGAESIVVTTPTSVELLPLARHETGKVVDKPHMLFVAPLADGCVLGGNGELAVMSEQGQLARSLRTPADVVPVCQDVEGHWWGWGGVDGCTWGRLDDTTARRPLHLPAVAYGPGPVASSPYPATYEATWLPATEGACRMSQNLLTRVGADGRARWEVPLPFTGAALEGGKRIIACLRQRVWTFDDADGSVCSVWPPLMAGATNTDNAVLRITTHGSSVYAATAHPADGGKTRIWDLGVDGRENAVPMVDVPISPNAFADFWVSAGSTQLFVVARSANDSEVRLYHALRPDSPRTAPVADASVEAQWGGVCNAAVWYDRARRNAVIFGRSPAETVRFSSSGMQRRTIQGISELWSGAAWSWGDLMVFRYLRDAFVRVTEPMDGGSVVLHERMDDKMERPLWEFSGEIGAEVFGMRRVDANQLLVFRQDLARGASGDDAAQKAILTGPVPELQADAWRGVVTLGDGRIMMLASTRIKREEQTCGYIWTPGSTALTTVPLPGMSKPLQPLSSNLWAYGDGVFTPADWARVAGQGPQVRPITWTNNYATVEDITADGFLDEWKDEEFVPIPQGRLAIRHPADHGELFRVAVDITNPVVVAAVAASPDFLDSCRIWAGRGDASTFDIHRVQVGLLSDENVMGPNRTVRRCAWQVSPDSRHCTLELEFALWPSPGRNPREAPSERVVRLGDLALRMTLDDPQLGTVDLVGSSRVGALGFVRLQLP